MLDRPARIGVEHLAIVLGGFDRRDVELQIGRVCRNVKCFETRHASTVYDDLFVRGVQQFIALLVAARG